MSDSFDKAFRNTIFIEGGYSDSKLDRGGKTKFGITEAVARAHGYSGDMKDLPLGTARAIYRGQYWDTLHLDQIALISEPIAHEMFDTGVNMGIGMAGFFLQRALTALNRQGKDYPDVKSDGVIGPVTINALRIYASIRGADGEKVLLRALNAQQGERYLSITEGRAANEEFLFGWFLNRVGLA